ncbi:MAG: sulfatase-like hydrolase/transferase, partial [Planctomycetales bacterium]|nr:sulfatase-like hydrolase/transferase [Planctomycetales bacterium]
DYFYHNEPTGEPVLYENLKQVRRDKYMTDLITDGAIEFLRNQPKDEPIFLYLPYTAPSAPFQHPDHKPDKPKVSNQWDSTEWQQGSRTTLKAIIERLDLGVGRVLETLEQTGRADEALVIFCSDNGAYPIAASNTPFRGHASELFEGGIHVACMARWPGKLPAGKTDDRPTMTFDLTASVLAAAGCQPAENLPPDGMDVLGQIAANKPAADRTLFWRARRADRTWKAVRDGNLKYIWRQDGQQLDQYLFDLSNDPGETRNLIDTLPSDAERLKESLAEWEAGMKAIR